MVWCGLQSCDQQASLRCSRCHSVYYCCKKHQKKAWSTHKVVCVPPTGLLQARSSVPEQVGKPWKCLACDQTMSSTFTFCGNCGNSKGDISREVPFTPEQRNILSNDWDIVSPPPASTTPDLRGELYLKGFLQGLIKHHHHQFTKQTGGIVTGGRQIVEQRYQLRRQRTQSPSFRITPLKPPFLTVGDIDISLDLASSISVDDLLGGVKNRIVFPSSSKLILKENTHVFIEITSLGFEDCTRKEGSLNKIERKLKCYQLIFTGCTNIVIKDAHPIVFLFVFNGVDPLDVSMQFRVLMQNYPFPSNCQVVAVWAAYDSVLQWYKNLSEAPPTQYSFESIEDFSTEHKPSTTTAFPQSDAKPSTIPTADFTKFATQCLRVEGTDQVNDQLRSYLKSFPKEVPLDVLRNFVYTDDAADTKLRKTIAEEMLGFQP